MVEMLKCRNCFKEKPATKFYLRKKGETERQWWCIECAPEIHRNWYRDNKKREFSKWVKGETDAIRTP